MEEESLVVDKKAYLGNLSRLVRTPIITYEKNHTHITHIIEEVV